MLVKKRNGKEVEFNKNKIVNSIYKAFCASNYSSTSSLEIANHLADKIEQEIYQRNYLPVDVEEIQDIVEEKISKKNYEVAKKYIIYRFKRKVARERKKSMTKSLDIIKDYLNLEDWKVNENSNMSYSLQGLNNHIASEHIEHFWKTEIYPEEISQLHNDGDLHIHDLGSLSTYCTGWNLEKLLIEGFGGVATKVESNPPRHFKTALGQIVNFLYTIQGECAGAIAFSNFDTLLAPFIHYDNLSYEQVYQHMQEFLYNMNVPTRVGFQCISEDTEILTPEGWKTYQEIKKGDIIKTFNIKNNTIEDKPVLKMFSRNHEGKMYNIKSKNNDQLITPNHRIVFSTKEDDYFELDEIKNILPNLKNENKTLPYPDDNFNIKSEYIEEIEVINNYKGIVWCPTTENQTIIARRNKKVFITGNSPFTNITMDLNVPSFKKEEPVIWNGEYQKEKYKDFQDEMDMINKAFAEVMLSGDKKGKVFSFPIPTYNITEDFDWENPVLDPVWKMTAKYGIPYFSNFINSDMKPEDARSMCPLGEDEKVLIRPNKSDHDTLSKVCDLRPGYKYFVNYKNNFVLSQLKYFPFQEMKKIKFKNGTSLEVSNDHLNPTNNGTKKTKDLTVDDCLPYDLTFLEGEGGNDKVGYILGAYAARGDYFRRYCVLFETDLDSDNDKKIKKFLKEIYSPIVNEKIFVDENIKKLRVPDAVIKKLVLDFMDEDKSFKGKMTTMSKDFRLSFLKGMSEAYPNKDYFIVNDLEGFIAFVSSLGLFPVVVGKKNHKTFVKLYDPYARYELFETEVPDKYVKKQEDSFYLKIDSIEEIGRKDAYCFEVVDEEQPPLFNLANSGIITHNCRLRLDNTKIYKRGGGLFGANPETGSIGVVTLNLPRIGYLAETKEEFLKQLDSLMEKAKESLIIKRKIVEKFTENGLYPYCKFYLDEVKQKRGSYWGNHFNTIGLNGMNEALQNFMGVNIADKKGKAFAKKIMIVMNEKLKEFQKETNLLFNLEATPAESTAYRFAKKDKEKYGDGILVANESSVRADNSEPYYTNSTHLPVDYTSDIFTALELQDDLQKLYTGGTVVHGFLGEQISGIESTKKLVKRIAENFQLPYYSITPTFSICPKHGYLKGHHEYCPKCVAEEEKQ